MFEVILVGLGLLLLVALHRRNNDLERRLRALEERLPPPIPQAAMPAIETAKQDEIAPAVEPPASTEIPTVEPSAEAPAFDPPPPPPPAPVATPTRGLEETIGSRWAVWVGGVALALGGMFLVRYSIEQGLVGPGVRITMGLLFAIALLGVGEWLRRREQPLDIGDFRLANIPAILTAAGTSTAFASVYAAYALYGLIGPATAFVALGLISFVTMAAAILHGPALGGLGLVAALASPVFIDTNDPSPVALVLYLAFAIGAAYGVARIRLWRWLAIAAASGGLVWGFVLFVSGLAWQAGLIAHVLIQLALAILFLVVDPYRHVAREQASVDRMVTIVLFWFAALAIVTGEGLGAGLTRPLFAGAVTAMMVAAAILYPAAASALLAAGATLVGTLAIWPVVSEAIREPERLVPDLPGAPYPEALTTFIGTAFVLAALVGLAGLVRLAFGRRLALGPVAAYAAGATLTPLAALIVAYWRIAYFDHSIPFAVVAAGLALVFAGAAAWLRRHDPDLDEVSIRLGVGALASAAIAALAAGLTFALDRGVLTIALSLSALGTAFVADRLRIRDLRWMVGALGVAVAARFAWDPSVVQGEIGTTPIFNWLLWGYGVPAAAFLLAARILARGGRDQLVRFVESLGFVFAALLVFLETRHALHAGDPFALRSDHLEAGLIVTEALAFTLLMVRLDLFRPDSLYRIASLVLGAVALVGAALSLGIVYNPYLTGDPVIGGAIFNSLLPAYLLPAVLAFAVALAARTSRPRVFVLGAAGLAVGLLIFYSVFEIRRLFHPDGRIGFLRYTSQGELWSYSLALLAIGLALLAYGVIRGLRLARLAALACLTAAVLKVFLIDLSALEGLTRALSFVGLGLALMLLGFVYQRVMAKSGTAPREG